MIELPWLEADSTRFPPTTQALKEPNGLLAAGGDLSNQRLLSAYRQGIFPWFNDGEPILWWTPSPRMVLFPEKLHISRSLRKTLRQKAFQITINRCFADVIQACSEPRSTTREENRGTWITDTLKNAYINFHHSGYAHSFEVWYQKQLVGGLYGVAIEQVFFGESMFSRMPNASKVAFVYMVKHLQKWGFELIDCQVYSDHLHSLGAEEIEREQFESIINHSTSSEIKLKKELKNWQETDIKEIFWKQQMSIQGDKSLFTIHSKKANSRVKRNIPEHKILC